MTTDRREKLSERMEIRLPYSDKRRFLDACRKAGDVPSDVLRTALRDYVARVETADHLSLAEDLSMKLVRNPLKSLGMAFASTVAAIGFAAQPSLADDLLFESYDRNEDGELAEGEVGRDIIELLDRDRSAAIDPSEFQPVTLFRETADIVHTRPNGEPDREVFYIIRKVGFAADGETELSVYSCSETMDVGASDQSVDEMLERLKTKCERNFARKT